MNKGRDEGRKGTMDGGREGKKEGWVDEQREGGINGQEGERDGWMDEGRDGGCDCVDGWMDGCCLRIQIYRWRIGTWGDCAIKCLQCLSPFTFTNHLLLVGMKCICKQYKKKIGFSPRLHYVAFLHVNASCDANKCSLQHNGMNEFYWKTLLFTVHVLEMH